MRGDKEMAEITKKQYEKKMKYLKWLQELNSCRIAEWHKSLKDIPDKAQNKNYLYDREYALEKLIERLNHRWATRNWTASDWNTNDLMTSNID